MKKLIFLLSCVFLAFPGSVFSRAPKQFGMSSVPRFRKSMLLGVTQEPKSFVAPLKLKNTSEYSSKPFMGGQPIIGTLIGLTFGAVGALTGAAIATHVTDYRTDYWYFTGAFIGGFSGYVFGNAFGTWNYARLKGVSGSFEGTFIGSLIGGFIGVALTEYLQNFAPFFLGPPVFATISFHLTRE